MPVAYRQLLIAADFDNTLTKKRLSFYDQCWRKALEESIGRTFADDEFNALIPRFSKTWTHTNLNFADAGLKVGDPKKFRQLLEGLFLDHIRNGDVQLNDGAIELLDFADSAAIPFGVCTNANESYAVPALGVLGVRPRMAAVVGYESMLKQILFGFRQTAYRRTLERAIASGTVDVLSMYAKPGVLPWLILFSHLRGDMAKEYTVPIIVEDRVANACGALQCHDEAVAFVVQDYDNRKEVIPDEFNGRIQWVENLLEVRDRLAKMI